jgi:hypothetical protein
MQLRSLGVRKSFQIFTNEGTGIEVIKPADLGCYGAQFLGCFGLQFFDRSSDRPRAMDIKQRCVLTGRS